MALSKIAQIEKEKGKPLPEVLQELYPQCGSQIALAQALNVSQSTISLWFTRYRLTEKRILISEEKEQIAS